ncbi:phosphatase PAP2 family protein [Arthrobacter sp. AQ5-05]|uniref:phosphatase PAP2 family protein n=1 Tax=Arthrobacter sp. AQ5-05 TaxID=2184581 RepID=UPI001E6084FB|nr:phosphatase PAP2 family protein [Arthrobacter sp. AQ5-05]
MSYPVPARPLYESTNPAHTRTTQLTRRTRLAVLPLPRLWLLWALLLSASVLSLGLIAKKLPGFTIGEFSLDQELSRDHNSALTAVAMTLNYVFSPVGGVVIIAAVALYLLVMHKSPINAVAFGGVAAAGWLSSQLFKVLVERQRPNPALLFDPLAPETGSNSFPSGHVALAVGLAWAFFFLARNSRWARLAGVAGITVPIIVAWSRLYIGVHYPSDVLASLLAASAMVILFAGVWNRYQGRILPRIPLLGRFGPVASPNNQR